MTAPVTLQPQYSLIVREVEWEVVPAALDAGMGLLPWSPLARGKLTRPWGETTARTETDAFGAGLYVQAEESDRVIVEATDKSIMEIPESAF